MCKFRPFNKHWLIERVENKELEEISPVLLPDDYKAENDERYGLVKFVCASSDCDNFLKSLNPEMPTWSTKVGTMDDVFVDSSRNNGNASLIVDKSMIEDVVIQDKTFTIVHQNYVVGVIDE